MNKTRSLLFFAGAAFVLSVSVSTPAVAAAAKTLTDVIVRNTDANPVPVKVIDAPRELRHGIALIGPPEVVGLTRFADIPGDVVLTDLVVTAVSGADYCNVAFAEHRGGTWISLAHVFPTNLDGSRQLHFESGLRPTPDRRAVIINNECNVHVLWSGYTDAP